MLHRFAFFNHIYFWLKKSFGSVIDQNFNHEFYENDQDTFTFLKVYYLEFFILFLNVYTLLYLNRSKKGEDYENFDDDAAGPNTMTFNPLTISFLKQAKSKLESF